jgi:hypothetical protein
MTINADPERHSLGPERLADLYQHVVVPRIFRFKREAVSQAHPTLILLGGQPGAGKTPMQGQAAREFDGHGGLVKIIGDDLRAFLPHYKALQREDDQSAAFYTDRDSGRLVEMALADAAKRQLNVLVEGTMRSPDVVASTLKRFRDAGYKTDARALAVSPELSSLGIMQRYIAQKESRGVGRMTTPQAHQAALDGMLQTLDRIQDGRLADRLTIYRRGGEVIQSFDLTSPMKGDELRASGVVQGERDRPLSPEVSAYVSAEYDRLRPAFERLGMIRLQPEPQAGPKRSEPER